VLSSLHRSLLARVLSACSQRGVSPARILSAVRVTLTRVLSAVLSVFPAVPFPAATFVVPKRAPSFPALVHTLVSQKTAAASAKVFARRSAHSARDTVLTSASDLPAFSSFCFNLSSEHFFSFSCSLTGNI